MSRYKPQRPTVPARRQAEGSAPQSGGPEDDALDRLEKALTVYAYARDLQQERDDLATVREALERQREERDEALDALRLFVHYDKPRVGIIGRFAVVDVRVNEADYHKARALLSASPPQGDAAEGTSPGATGPSFIPRDTDEYPSDAMPSAGHSDWREEAEWWQRTCEYWRARALGEPLPDGGGA